MADHWTPGINIGCPLGFFVTNTGHPFNQKGSEYLILGLITAKQNRTFCDLEPHVSCPDQSDVTIIAKTGDVQSLNLAIL